MSETDGTRVSAIVDEIKAGRVDGLRARLLAQPPSLPLVPKRGDFDLNPSTRPAEPRELKPAAVLMPIVRRTEPTVLFTRRTENLSRHPGQVSFPGGRAQSDDASLIATALRETREETGIGSDFVTVAGFLDAYETGTGYAILPVVGLLAVDFTLLPEPAEVAQVFEVPLAFLLDPANRQKNARQFEGRPRTFYSFTYESHYIWGATAAMLVNFAERLNRA